jgi:transposase-like protein
MVKLKCCHCGGDHLARNGLTQNGKQPYLCSDSGRMSRDNPQPNGYTASTALELDELWSFVLKRANNR